MKISYVIFLSTTLFLSGCGFHPLNQTGAEDLTNTDKGISIKMTGDGGYVAHRFHQELIKRLKTDEILSKRLHKIQIELKNSTQDLAYGRDATVTRTQQNLTLTYEARFAAPQGSKEKEVTAKGALESYSSYGVDSQAEFSNLSSRLSTQDQLILHLVNDLVAELSYFATSIRN